MAQPATLNWTPSTSASITGQRVEYRDTRDVNNTWQTVTGMGTLGAAVSTTVVPSLVDNVRYEFRVISICGATETATDPVQNVAFACPLLTITPDKTSIQVSFNGLAKSITGYELTLYDATGTQTIATHPIVSTSTNTQVDTFTGLTTDTAYQIQLTLKSGSLTKACGLKTARTQAGSVSVCTAPSNVTATLTTSLS